MVNGRMFVRFHYTGRKLQEHLENFVKETAEEGLNTNYKPRRMVVSKRNGPIFKLHIGDNNIKQVQILNIGKCFKIGRKLRH